jgi:hypothetical protein
MHQRTQAIVGKVARPGVIPLTLKGMRSTCSFLSLFAYALLAIVSDPLSSAWAEPFYLVEVLGAVNFPSIPGLTYHDVKINDVTSISNSAAVGDPSSPAIATSEASANLANGKLRVFSSVNSISDGGSQAIAGFFDQLTFSVPGVSDGTPFEVGIGVNVEGIVVQNGGANFQFTAGDQSAVGFTGQVFFVVDLISGTSASFSVSAGLGAEVGNFGIVDFSNSATVFLDLSLAPAGTTFTSASGVFLTAQEPTPVPEPNTMLFLGTGLAGLSASVLRRRRS